MNIIYINGRFIKKEEASISPFDRGFLYGDGVFDTLRAYNGIVLDIDRHIDRLYKSLSKILIPITISKRDIVSAIYKILELNSQKNALIRVTISRGVGYGIDIGEEITPTIVIFSKEFSGDGINTDKGISLRVTGHRRIKEGIVNEIKSNNFLVNILARAAAKKDMADEALLLSEDGLITEGSVSNIFIVADNILITPPLKDGILDGITRQRVLDIAKTRYKVKEISLSITDLYSADECFVTNTAYEIMPVSEIDGRRLWKKIPGEITSRLIVDFKACLRDLLIRCKS